MWKELNNELEAKQVFFSKVSKLCLFGIKDEKLYITLEFDFVTEMILTTHTTAGAVWKYSLKERNEIEITCIKSLIYVGTLERNCVLFSSHNVIPTNCERYIGAPQQHSLVVCSC